ncbi:MAG: ion transporter [Pseudomonadota bacterium]|nr:ion transporter [Pseudomonadota bacterium]
MYRQLEPTAWPHKGLSPVNAALMILILAAVMLAILETEPLVAAGHELWFRRVELAIGAIFLAEYLARVWTAVENPRFASARFPRLRYMVTPIAIIDLLAILPALFAIAGGPSLVLRFFRILRMLRLAKLGRASRAWDDIKMAVYARRHEFGIVLGIVAITILIAGSLLYFAEAEAQPDKFGSIPRSLWWAIVTLTTVGYGDAYPVTVLGRILAGMIAVMGVCLIALPTGIFAASFTDAMERRRNGKAEPGTDA